MRKDRVERTEKAEQAKQREKNKYWEAKNEGLKIKVSATEITQKNKSERNITKA